MDVTELALTPGGCIQTSVHRVHVVLLRGTNVDLLIPPRDYTCFLAEALLDVGRQVGLHLGGLGSLPWGEGLA